METTQENVTSPVLKDVCVKDEFDFPSNSVEICENLDYKCYIKKETDDLCGFNYENGNFDNDFDDGVARNDMCLKNEKSDVDDLKEGFSYDSSCSTDSYELSYVVKTKRKLPSNLLDLKNGKESHRERLTNAANGIILLFCDACNFSTKYRGNLLKHIKRKHGAGHNFKPPKEPNRIPCYFCQFRTDSRTKVSRHIFRVHVFDLPEGEFDEVKPCYICNYESGNKMEFLAHFIATHHVVFLKEISKQSRTGLVHSCDLCNYSTYCKHTLNKHIEAVHQKIRPYTCHLCDYAANRHSDLRIHLSAKHDQIKPFKCGFCNYSSSYKKHLRRHIRTQHEMKKKRKRHVRRYR